MYASNTRQVCVIQDYIYLALSIEGILTVIVFYNNVFHSQR